MASSNRGKSNGMTTIWLIRLFSICLVVVCLIHIIHEHSRILADSTLVHYVNDGNSIDLQPLDLDAPIHFQSGLRAKTKIQKDPIPKLVVEPFFRAEQNRIDNGINDTARCAQYGVNALPDDEKHQRRIFFGSMLADESAEVLLAHAIEVYNKYSVVALVESNTTHIGTPRTMNYGPTSINARLLRESEMFGTTEHTKVIIDYWLEDMPDLKYMNREVEQRNEIWKIWVSQGMTPRDIGIMSDLDEVVSRDFLNAIQVCDFPKLRYDPEKRHTCQTPKLILSTIQFESTPLCVKKHEWFHPDLILGECILGVGDPTGRVTPERTHHVDGKSIKTVGLRSEDWGARDYNRYPQDIIDNNRFPLWDGRDIREVNGSKENLMNFVNANEKGMGETAHFGTAYHLHNWFKDMEVLRHKFATYGHADEASTSIPLSSFPGDVEMMVRCVRGLGNQVPAEIGEIPENAYHYYENNSLLPDAGEAGQFFTLGGNRPIYFQNRSYVEERHTLVQNLVRADEEKYGTIYKLEDR